MYAVLQFHYMVKRDTRILCSQIRVQARYSGEETKLRTLPSHLSLGRIISNNILKDTKLRYHFPNNNALLHRKNIISGSFQGLILP